MTLADAPADARPIVRSRLGIAAVVLAAASALFPVWVFLVGVVTQNVDILEADTGVWVLVTVLVLVAEVALMPVTAILALVFAILAIRRSRGTGRRLGVAAIALLAVGLVLVVAQIAVYVGVTTLAIR